MIRKCSLKKIISIYLLKFGNPNLVAKPGFALKDAKKIYMIEITETKDFRLLAEMNEEIQTLHHSSYPSVFKPFDKESVTNFFEASLENENAVAFIAKENGTALGYVLLFIIHFADNPFQYSRSYVLVDQILVLEQYRTKGIGKLLLEATFSFAQSKKINLVELNHWSRNDAARRFFNKSGFNYYNEKMWKLLG
ncbi:MAG: GNAT family N-acetyltransferase [Bacteroidota bacterium]